MNPQVIFSAVHSKWTMLHTMLASDALSNGGKSSLVTHSTSCRTEVSSDGPGAYHLDRFPQYFRDIPVALIKALRSKPFCGALREEFCDLQILLVHGQMDWGPAMPLTSRPSPQSTSRAEDSGDCKLNRSFVDP